MIRFWLKRLAFLLWTGLLVWTMVGWMIREHSLDKGLVMIQHLSVPIVALNLLLVMLVYLIAKFLLVRFTFCRQSLLSLVRLPWKNLNVLPFESRVIGLPFALLLAANIPYMSFWEEMYFRNGTHDWRDGIIRSIVFGLIHLFAGVPIGVSLAVMVNALCLTQLYFIGGVQLSAVSHMTYNFILVVSMIAFLPRYRSLRQLQRAST